MRVRKQHSWTGAEVAYLRKLAPNNTVRELNKKFNKKFNLQLNDRQISGKRYFEGIRVGKFERPTSFKKGHSPWNKGISVNTGGEAGWFKKGDKSPQWLPVGTERTDQDYVIVKIKEPDVWKRKQYLLWEETHGKVPDNHLVIFADGDKRNFDTDNLTLVSRGQYNRLVFNDLLCKDTKLTKTMLEVVKIHEAIDKRKDD